MPVVTFSFDRIEKMLPGIKLETVLKVLPFIGLDIEDVGENSLRIEYNPNRPDLGSDYGICRALRGLLEIESGIPKFRLSKKGRFIVEVDQSVQTIRPFIVALVAKSGNLDDGTIKQLIGMQEDLHNGIGRKRVKASIGLHDLDSIRFPLKYKAESDRFSFVPLDQTNSQTIEIILRTSLPGRQYGHIFAEVKNYPILIDSENNVISFPPIINSAMTKIKTDTHNLFVEVTGNSRKATEDMLSNLAITLFEAGFKIHPVLIRNIENRDSFYTPKIAPSTLKVESNFINKVLGLDLKASQVANCLRKSRLDAKIMANERIIKCFIPRYRIDILSAIDLAEEAAIGYGIYNLEPKIPSTFLFGQKSQSSSYMGVIRQTMIGLQMIEVVNLSLVSRRMQYDLPGIGGRDKALQLDATKSNEHEILRDSLLPSLLMVLSHNIHEEYPQRIFELGKIFQHVDSVKESWSLGVVVAHNKANYTEVKSILHTLMKIGFGKDVQTNVGSHPLFINGRCANIVVDEKKIGSIGEVAPLAIDNFNIRVPAAAFELNVSQLFEI